MDWTASRSRAGSRPSYGAGRNEVEYVAGVNSRRVLAAAARRLGRRPRLATAVLRLPRVLSPRLRSSAYRAFSWPLAKRLGAETVVSVTGGGRMVGRTHDRIGRGPADSGGVEPDGTP